MLSPLQEILAQFRAAARTPRELGDYFEELIRTYLRHEPYFADKYSDVWLLSEVPAEHKISKADTGIDLVALTKSGEFHAVQCKFYDEGHVIQKADIDSFFTASGQKPFTHRVIVVTSNQWSKNAENSLFDQQPPVTLIDLNVLEASQIDWAKFKPKAKPALKPKFAPRPHQKTAIKKTVDGLKKADRGKLIMACGTGKTFTSLKIAEEMAGKGKRVLFLVPSLALLSQTLTEWTHQSQTPLHSFAVCSDAEVGKKRSKEDDDIVATYAHELRYPATTNAKWLAQEFAKRHDDHHMSVVFSTYHSIQVIHDAQHRHKLADFDLIICDEAHRTTGATFENEEESTFVRVHDAKFIRGGKRLYMTATPRIYANVAKAKALQENIALCSMDDAQLYGEQLHVITFSEAVELDLLTDYKVIVLTIDEDVVSSRLQELLKDDDNQLKVDDAARIVGCWKALSKHEVRKDLSDDTQPMRRAVAFCQVIEPSTGRTHKVSSKQISEMFQSVIDAYQESAEEELAGLFCQTQHVDGSMNAAEKEAKINWLKEEPPENTCRILSNVRCLSEGVDVPALDAVLFLSPRSSQVEVVQSVGRVMRKAPGKKLGYVILPVVIPHGMEPHEALNDNNVYRVVWEVLQALRSHDDRFDAFINKLDLLEKAPDKMEVIAITDSLAPKPAQEGKEKAKGKGEYNLAEKKATAPKEIQGKLKFEIGEIEKALYAKLVQKCGNRLYWEDWANDIAKIAQTHIGRITAIVNNPKNKKEAAAFQQFANELRDDLNDSITDEEVIEMLAQHLITKPVFDALFTDYNFGSQNPVSQGMQNILTLLNEHRLDKEADTLESFYASVRRRAEGIDNAQGKQKIVVELYDKFFRNAFPKMTERLGIVYTPVEVVDFIIHSVNDILQQEFGQTLGSEGVHILDPFVGTGTFITRLMQSGLIKPEQLPHKYKLEIHCNEIVLLAYYIAAINIEAVYHGIVGGKYQPFEGILLTDTFQMYEGDDKIEQFFPDNSKRRKRQKKLDIRVLVGNPPYSALQASENDNNKKIAYNQLDSRIRETFAANSKAVLKNALYDPYVRAIRWGCDRIGDAGVLGFVCGSAWIERSFADGMRQCLREECSRLYVLHLRGDVRKNMLSKGSAGEGGNIFDAASMTGNCVVFLVKNKSSDHCGEIYFHDVGNDLSSQRKREILTEFEGIRYLTTHDLWQRITPDAHQDWINQREETFEEFIVLGSKQSSVEKKLFQIYSSGVKTNRDAWCYNASREELRSNMRQMIAFYNHEVERFQTAVLSKPETDANSFIDLNPKKISWTRELKQSLARGKIREFREAAVIQSHYRPFCRRWSYFDRHFNNCVYKMPSLFGDGTESNLVICVSGVGSRSGYTAFISDRIVDLEIVEKSQCFPFYVYNFSTESGNQVRFIKVEPSGREEAITDVGRSEFVNTYSLTNSGESITKSDLFYYVYGLLHSQEYRDRYRHNLSKELPRIPAVKKFKDFQAFSQAGRDLAHWHLDYETVACYPATMKLTIGGKKQGAETITADTAGLAGLRKSHKLKDEHFYVRKMKFPKVKDPETGKSVNDRSTVIYNEYFTVTDIPLDAYDYVVNGKSAIEWVMERQAVTTDKASGIVNDANLWATETMHDAAYPLELLLRVITVSLETNRIVTSLPMLEID